MLHVNQHATTVALEVLNRVGDHRDAFIKGCLQRVDDVIVPTLGNDAHGTGVGIDEVTQRCIVVNFALGATG